MASSARGGHRIMLLGLEKAACLHRARAHCIRMPEFEGAWQLARDKPSGTTKFMNKYAAFSLLVIDEWLLDDPDESTRSMLLELLERRYDQASTVFCTHDVRGDWHQRLATGRPRRLLAEGPQDVHDGSWRKAHSIRDLAWQDYHQKHPERFRARPQTPAPAGIVGINHLPKETATN